MMTIAVPAASSSKKTQWLPALRDDLHLFEGPPAMGGEPTWTVYDPVRGRYFQIGWLAFRLLSHWRLGDVGAILRAALHSTTLEADEDDIKDMVFFLRVNNLLAGDSPGQKENYLAQINAAKMHWGKWLLHNYLFIRVPLIRPDAFLAKSWPWVRPLFTAQFLLLVIALGVLGLFLAARRWDEFLATFMHFFSLEGAILLGCTITATNILHEFGHAYMAKRFGCRVQTIGIAFVVLFPVFYSDITDAWRLVSRRQRLLIGAAGMLTELALAMIATLIWSFLPDGMLRSAVFMVATVTWITTLAVNLNPLMKFDGYFLLSDLLGIQNLQDRAFALARWQMRECLFGFAEPIPELLPRRPYLILLAWAYASWVWRFFLFFGIALLVYHAFFKVLGIFLMAVEIGWFILRPLYAEISEWWRRKDQVRLNRPTITMLLLLGGASWILLTPWESDVSMPATFEAGDYAILYPPMPARIQAVLAHPGDQVTAGQLLYQLESPDLQYQIENAEQELALTLQLIQRQAASATTLEQLGVLEGQLAKIHANLRGLQERNNNLQVRASVAGQLRDVPTGITSNLWVNENVLLGRVVNTHELRLRAYVTGKDLDRVRADAVATFYPEDSMRPALAMHVTKVEQVAIAALDNVYLSSTIGGSIAVREDKNHRQIPTEALYRVYFVPQDKPSPSHDIPQVLRGTVHVEAEAISPIARLWRFVVGVLVRESGF